ncbi:MAG: sulfotransferase, partial [Desulfobacteraceae bacterium]|nr:sulfotransferase [Desulfobacteraceae bacterium]
MSKEILSKNSINNSKAICILGMHRSGTSAVSRVINLLGAYLGELDELYGPRDDNPEGFWERKDIVDFHDELLRVISQRWDTSLPLSDGWMASEPIAEFRQRLKKIISGAFSGREVWAWKDPRTCIFLPLWQGLLAELNSYLSIVYVIRNPVDVAKSLAKRNKFPVEKSYGIWLNYNLSALKMLSDVQLVFISYDQLLDAPQQQLSRIAEHLSIPYPSADANLSGESISFLRHDLRHSHSATDDLEGAPQAVIDLYRLLMDVAEDKVKADATFFNKVAGMDMQFRECSELFRWDMENYFRNENSSIPELKVKVDQADQVFYESQQQIIKQQHQLSDRDEQLSNRDQQYTDLSKQYTDLSKQYTDLSKQYTDLSKQYTDLSKQYTERDQQLAETTDRLSERD